MALVDQIIHRRSCPRGRALYDKPHGEDHSCAPTARMSRNGAKYMKQYRARPEVKAKRAEYDARPEVWAKRAKYNEKAEYGIIKKSEEIAEIIKRHGFAKIMDQKGMVLYVPPGYIQSTAAQGPVPASDRFGDQVGRRP